VGETVPESFVAVLADAELSGQEVRRVEIDCVPVLLARSQSGDVCALAHTCTHLGGPLSEGSRDDDTITCPWHGSRFDLRTGAVIEGPAVFDQPRLSTRVRDGSIEVGLPDAAGAELPELATFVRASPRDH
jgi:nitrite reductase/ring-hydroxylating ferredoxin subunit